MSLTKLTRESFGRHVSSGRRSVNKYEQCQRSPNMPHADTNHSDHSTGRQGSPLSSSPATVRCVLDFHGSSDEDASSKPASPQDILKGVIAYIEVRSNTENRFEGISKQMEILGAQISKKFTSDVTHVVFKDGKKSTKEKAIKKGVHLVSVLWIDSCKCSGQRVPEDKFPVSCASNTDGSSLIIGRPKRIKFMQPKSFEEEVRLSSEKIERRQQRINKQKARTPVPASSYAKMQDTMTCSPFVVRPSLSPRIVPRTPGDFLKHPVEANSLKSSRETKSDDSSSPSESHIERLAKRLRFAFSDERCEENHKRIISSDEQDENKERQNDEDEEKINGKKIASSESTRTIETTKLKPGVSPTDAKTEHQRASLEDFQKGKPVARRKCRAEGKSNVRKMLATESERPNRKRKRKSHSLVMTSIHYSDQDIVRSVVKKLGLFSIHDNVCSQTSHVIAGDGKRTLNILKAISRGCWVLSLEWIMKSLEAGRWIEEEPYELSDFFPSAQLCRLERATLGLNYHSKLLADVPTIYVGSNTSPPSDEIVNLIRISGGHTSRSFRNASICIGQVPKKIEASHISEKWLLDCITSQTVLPFEKYQTEKPQRTIRSPSPVF